MVELVKDMANTARTCQCNRTPVELDKYYDELLGNAVIFSVNCEQAGCGIAAGTHILSNGGMHVTPEEERTFGARLVPGAPILLYESEADPCDFRIVPFDPVLHHDASFEVVLGTIGFQPVKA